MGTPARWWFATQIDGTRINRFSYVTAAAARRDNPDAPMIMSLLGMDMAESLEGVAR